MVSRYFEDHEENGMKADFADHVATLEVPRPGCEILTWRKPGTSINKVRYVCVDGVLYVSGDLGEAVYCAYRDWDLHEWSRCPHLDYFASKCEASEYGKPCKEWDEDTALQHLKEDFDALEDDEEREKLAEAYEMARGACESAHAWTEFLGTDYAQDIIGIDAWELGGIGLRIGRRIAYHLLGLQAAIDQIDLRSRDSVPVEVAP